MWRWVFQLIHLNIKILFRKNEKNTKTSLSYGTPSPWPLFASIAALLLTTGAVMYMHQYRFGGFVLTFGFLYLIGILSL